jgi:hypothetical protein
MIVSSISPAAFHSDTTSRNVLINAREKVKAAPGSTIQFKLTDGNFVTLSEAQLDTAVVAMATFIEACFTKESETLAGIIAGTVTELDEIDTAFAGVSNVYP